MVLLALVQHLLWGYEIVIISFIKAKCDSRRLKEEKQHELCKILLNSKPVFKYFNLHKALIRQGEKVLELFKLIYLTKKNPKNQPQHSPLQDFHLSPMVSSYHLLPANGGMRLSLSKCHDFHFKTPFQLSFCSNKIINHLLPWSE